MTKYKVIGGEIELEEIVVPPDDPPPDDPPTDGVSVNPATIKNVLQGINAHPAGTTFMLEDGDYFVRGINLRDVNALDNPYTIMARNKGGAVFRWDGSDVADGRHWDVINLQRCRGVILRDLTFRGRFSKHILALRSWPNNEGIVFRGCDFEGSWYQSTWISGNNSGYEDCVWTNNGLRREGSAQFQQPYTTGAMDSQDSSGARDSNHNLWLKRCKIHRNYGEGCTWYATDGLTIEDCEITDNRQVGVYLLGCQNVTFTRNRVLSIRPISNHTTVRGLWWQLEASDIGDPENFPGVGVHILDNVFDAGSRGLRNAIVWNHDNRIADKLRYSDWTIRGNQFLGDFAERPVVIGRHDSSKPNPQNCTIDIPLNDSRVSIANPEFWEVI